jgi:hypothetical protein
MNEALQQPLNVLLSGPFKKSSERPTERIYPRPLLEVFQGRSSGSQVLGQQQLDAKPTLLRQQRTIAQISRMIRNGSKLGDAGKE